MDTTVLRGYAADGGILDPAGQREFDGPEWDVEYILQLED